METAVNLWFSIWLVATQCVNFAFYLVITRGVYGWVRTVAVYAAVYLLPLVAMIAYCVGLQDMEAYMPVSFVAFFSVWCVLTVVLSRGAAGRRLFAVLVCGVHQLGAFGFSLLLLHRLRPAWLGGLLSCALMVFMGVMLCLRVLPRVSQMAGRAGWRFLNTTAVMNFVLLYVTGIWPMFVATGPVEHVVHFVVANVVAVAYFPVALSFAEKNRVESTLALVEKHMRLMANEMRVRRGAIDEARRIRHDRRHHRIAVCGLLLNGKVKEALAYLEGLDEQRDETPLSKLVWCENETVNAILSGYSRKALAAHVRFSAVANVGRQSRMPDVEAVALVANILEDAIMAAGRDGEVTCTLRQREDSFGLTVTNTVPPDFRLSPEGLPCAVRGIGLESVRNVVDKYHGTSVYSLAGNVLTCETVVFFERDSDEDCAVR